MKKAAARELIKLWIEEENRIQLIYFNGLNPDGGH